MQAFRLMGMPDKIIAFDELPENLVTGFEMREPIGPAFRSWREWLGKKKRVTKISPERDPFTQQMRIFQPIVEMGNYFYIMDETLNADRERWEAICDYVRRNAPTDFRLKDKIEDMAIPLAPDVRSDVTIEPEEIVIIPLPKLAKEETDAPTDETGKSFSKENPANSVLSDKEIKLIAHVKNCVSFGRASKYTEGCPKCDILKARRVEVAVS